MVYLCVRHHVKDYVSWREGFDMHAPARQAAGTADEPFVLRNVDDPNEITVLLGWKDIQTARAFAESISLKDAAQASGVVGLLEIRFLDSTD
jgi:hypothetical protein